MKILSSDTLIFFFLLCSLCFRAQVKPADKSTLNYTQVLFEYPEVKNAEQYRIELSSDGSENPIKYFSTSTVKIISGLSFGQSYTWRVTALNKKGKKIATGAYFSFRIKSTQLINQQSTRMRITHIDPSIDTNSLVLFDYNRIAVNRKGEPVWYLPDIPGKVNFTERIRDLRITKEGTFTFFNNRSAIECDINGTVLWEAPLIVKGKKDSSGFYHHCFEKLKNGHYMVLGNRFTYKAIPASYPESRIKKLQEIKTINGVLSARVEYGNIMEFDAAKELVWYWDSEQYIDDRDLFVHGNADTLENLGPHMNAFDIDEEKNLVSVGFRDLSRIIVIDKTTGKVINSYGEKLPSGEAKLADKRFRFQHDARFLKDGRIAVFNNNDIIKNNSAVSSVLILSAPDKQTGDGVEWTFPCNFDTLADGRSLKGGGVSELDNSNFLVCMGNMNRVFEVNRDKKIVWDGFYEQYSKAEQRWKAYPQYRVSAASSLYPSYFTVKAQRKKKGHFAFSITNEGSEADDYRFTVTSDNGVKLMEFAVAPVEAGATRNISIEPGLKKTPGAKKFIIEVESVKNSTIKRVLSSDNFQGR